MCLKEIKKHPNEINKICAHAVQPIKNSRCHELPIKNHYHLNANQGNSVPPKFTSFFFLFHHRMPVHMQIYWHVKQQATLRFLFKLTADQGRAKYRSISANMPVM